MQRAFIVSLKFAPGLKKEFQLLGENYRSRGIDVEYLLAEGYRYLENNTDKMSFFTQSNNFKEILVDTIKYQLNNEFNDIILSGTAPDFVLFYNAHILNLFILKTVKAQPNNIPTILYFHDPYKPDKRPYGLSRGSYITLGEFIQKLTLHYIDHVILPSQYALQLFQSHYPKFRGTIHVAPLMVPDHSGQNSGERKYFAMVGGYHIATGHDIFIDLVNYIASKDLNYQFALISSSNISPLLSNLSDAGRKIVTIINNNIITDTEINNIVRQSFAVFRLDREVTQSGVIPVAYMNATPVIGRDIPGLTQHIQHNYNGYVVPYHCEPDSLIKAMDTCISNFHLLSSRARTSFEEIWSEKNFDNYYGWLTQ